MALGGTRFGVARTVVLPFAKGGIIGGTMLALGRALGETAAVLIIISPDYVIKTADPRGRHPDRPRRSSPANFGNATKSQLSALLDRRLRAVRDHPRRQQRRGRRSSGAAAAARRRRSDHGDARPRPPSTDGAAADAPHGPRRPPKPRPRRRRHPRSLTADDWFSLVGSLLSSFALVYVGYVHLLDFSGTLGFVVCWYLVFLRRLRRAWSRSPTPGTSWWSGWSPSRCTWRRPSCVCRAGQHHRLHVRQGLARLRPRRTSSPTTWPG